MKHRPVPSAALCYAILGLAANGLELDHTALNLEQASSRVVDQWGHYKRALFAMASGAALGEQSVLDFLRGERL